MPLVFKSTDLLQLSFRTLWQSKSVFIFLCKICLISLIFSTAQMQNVSVSCSELSQEVRYLSWGWDTSLLSCWSDSVFLALVQDPVECVSPVVKKPPVRVRPHFSLISMLSGNKVKFHRGKITQLREKYFKVKLNCQQSQTVLKLNVRTDKNWNPAENVM